MRKIWLAIGGTVGALLVGELLCRIFTEDPFKGLGESRSNWRVEGLAPDPQLEFSFQPGYQGRMTLAGEYDFPFRINAQGLRDDHDYAEAHPGVTRILLVGDSFVFGVGVDLPDTLGKQLERALNETHPPQPVEVVAAGVPSYGIDGYALLIERWVPRLHPDLVIVALYPGNDLVDYELKARDPRIVIEGMLVGQRQAWSWNLRRYSSLAHLLLQSFNPYTRIESQRPDHPTKEDLDRIFRTIQPWIARIAAAQRPPGPPIAITACYARETVPAWLSGTLEAEVRPWKEVLAECARDGLTVLDPKPAWLAPGLVVRDFFFERDPHYRPAGTRFLAEWLAQQLRAQHPELLDGADR